MIISFDLDDTLIPGAKQFATEKRSMLQKLLGIEEIRIGAIELIKTCQSKGHKVYIYTSSLRSVSKIRLMFYSYAISLDKVINQKIHDQVLKSEQNKPSKYPSAFDIDIHVDDSKGVEMEGQRFNFRTIIVSDDVNWMESIAKKLY